MFTTSAQAWNQRTDWRTGRPVPADPRAARPAWRPPAKPGTLPKRPLRFIEGLDGGFRLIRAQPGATVGLALVVNALWTLALGALLAFLVWLSMGFLTTVFSDPEALSGFALLAQFGAVAHSLLTLSLIQFAGAFAALAAHASFTGERLGLGRAWAELRGVRLRLIGTVAALFGCHVALLALCALPGLIAAGLHSTLAATALMVIGFVLWVGLTVYLAVRTAFTGPAIACERLGGRAAVRRSWALTRRGFWRTLGQLLFGSWLSSRILEVVIAPLMLVLYAAALVVLALAAGSELSGGLAIGIAAGLGLALVAASIASAAVLMAYWAGLAAVVYFDRRMRAEGYDLVLLREAEARG